MTATTALAGWLADRSTGPAPPGSVLVHAPSSAFQAPGGGENQLVQTGRHLEPLGVTVRPFCPWVDRIEEARLLHVFGMSREGLELARVAKARRVPVVLSPICWFEPRAIAALAPDAARRAFDLAKWAARMAAPRGPGWRRSLLNLADAILPNSRAEADQLVRLFGTDRRAIRVVPNGVEPRFADADPGLFRSACSPGEFALYVGRIEPRKNVLGLARALAAARIRLVVIGDPTPSSRDYAQACRAAGGTMTRWLPRMDHDDPLLASAYAAARAFALPSWFETPGLAALEAASAGCPVAITPFGCTREYFGTDAHYTRPDRPGEIARAVREAWDAGPPAGLAGRIAGRYSWSAVARLTAEVYDEVAG